MDGKDFDACRFLAILTTNLLVLCEKSLLIIRNYTYLFYSVFFFRLSKHWNDKAHKILQIFGISVVNNYKNRDKLKILARP